MYVNDLIKHIFKGVLGIAIGLAFVYITMPDSSFSSALALSLFFIGLPYGWQLVGRFLDGLGIVGSVPVMIFVFFLRIAISLFLGMVAYPIAMMYTIIKAIKYA